VGQFSVTFENHFAGIDKYDETMPYQLSHTPEDEDEDDASVTWTIS